MKNIYILFAENSFQYRIWLEPVLSHTEKPCSDITDSFYEYENNRSHKQELIL